MVGSEACFLSCPAAGPTIRAHSQRRLEPGSPRGRVSRGPQAGEQRAGSGGCGARPGCPCCTHPRRRLPGTARPVRQSAPRGSPPLAPAPRSAAARLSAPPLVAGSRPPTWPRPQPRPRRSHHCRRKNTPSLQAASLGAKWRLQTRERRPRQLRGLWARPGAG